MEEGAAPERLTVSVATLSLLAAAADDRPLLCVVDDAHWLDQASADALTFVARRLYAEGVVMLFAAREPETVLFPAPGIAELRIRRSRPGRRRALLARAPRSSPSSRRSDWSNWTQGNPLALLEIARALSEQQRRDAHRSISRSRSALRSSGRFSTAPRRSPKTHSARCSSSPRAIPATPRRSGRRSRRGTRRGRARGRRGRGPAAPRRLDFCHPLARSAVYQSSRPADRRRAHERWPRRRPSPTAAPGSSPQRQTDRTRRSRPLSRMPRPPRVAAAVSRPRRRRSSAQRS